MTEPLLPVAEALDRVLALMAPVGTETAPLAEAGGRVLAEDAVAGRDQPPFPASAMDGWAVRAADVAAGAPLRRVGTAPAGRAWAGSLGPGETVRIFTGAPLPDGADAVLIQEDAEAEGDRVSPRAAVSPGQWVRPAGLDFADGFRIAAPRRLSAADIALLGAMNVAAPGLRRRPRVAIIPTGDELVEPGETPAADQIIASSHVGLAAMLSAAGAAAEARPIARDTRAALGAALEAAAAEADLVVTLGGASVGEHDLVREVVGDAALAFYRIAMRPGKPLMAGRFHGVPLIGLPGNPVSAMVCGRLFLRPALDALLGLPAGPPPRETATLAADLPANGPREHFMRATLTGGPGAWRATAFADQDSSRLGVLAAADALIVRAPHAPALSAGGAVEILRLRD